MVLDTSALIAYLKGEPEADRLEDAMLAATSLYLLFVGDDFSATDIPIAPY